MLPRLMRSGSAAAFHVMEKSPLKYPSSSIGIPGACHEGGSEGVSGRFAVNGPSGGPGLQRGVGDTHRCCPVESGAVSVERRPFRLVRPSLYVVAPTPSLQ